MTRDAQPGCSRSRGGSRFREKVAVVTGAGSGIGRQTAELLAEEGGRVALVGRTRERLEETEARLPTGRARVLPGAHEDPEFAERCVEEVVDVWGRIDLLFNNAGTYVPGPLSSTTDEAWREALASNLTGPFVMTRAVLPVMRRQQSGVIVNNSSTLGLRPIAGAASYCVAKSGLVMLTTVTAIEEAQHGVRACAICPGVVDTPIHGRRPGVDPAELDSFLEQAAGMHPLGRVGRPEDIAEMVLFLASDASSWTTGAVIKVDGGISLA